MAADGGGALRSSGLVLDQGETDVRYSFAPGVLDLGPGEPRACETSAVLDEDGVRVAVLTPATLLYKQGLLIGVHLDTHWKPESAND